ncbi:hypothetical protein [Sphaerisporangium fuscum]|nr:hypothetical protein [Sphaerisporangium fuscum]
MALEHVGPAALKAAIILNVSMMMSQVGAVYLKGRRVNEVAPATAR